MPRKCATVAPVASYDRRYRAVYVANRSKRTPPGDTDIQPLWADEAITDPDALFPSPRTARFGEAMRGWLADDKIVFDETFYDGIDSAFDAFTGMMHGANVGKTLVRL